MKFSIIIPVSNRLPLLRETLFCLKHINYPRRNFEIIFVQNNSSKEITQELIFFKKKTQLNIKLLEEKKIGPSFARNKGVCNSSYNHLIFLDDDVVFMPNLLNLYKNTWKTRPHFRIIGGKIIPKFTKKTRVLKLYFSDQWKWMLAMTNFGETERELVQSEGLFSANMSIKIEKYEKEYPLFCEQLGRKNLMNILLFGEDYELCTRELLNNKKILYAPKIIVENIIVPERITFFYFLKRLIKGGMETAIIDHIHSKNDQYLSYSYSFSFKELFSSPLSSLSMIVYFISYSIFRFLFRKNMLS